MVVKLQVYGNIPDLMLGDATCQPARAVSAALAIGSETAKGKRPEHSGIEQALAWMMHRIARRALFTRHGVTKFPKQK